MAVMNSNVTRAVCAAALCILVMASSSRSEPVEASKCVKMDPCVNIKCERRCQEVAREHNDYPFLASCDKTDVREDVKMCCCRFYVEQHPLPPPQVAGAKDDNGLIG
uniref:Bifunctional inhibitor/plant lipid transfer protein/seed storage helical domain-containing protein n=1 Tax=Setaria viridis TaxID=4556 RepID=A0A4U6TJG0_SETVI|nr:hypothetical protein SEVIR_8G250600v2 [Setaria viridis]